MKKTIMFAAAAAILTACCTEKQTYTIPLPEDVVMYQVNPRVFAAENSFNAVAEHR